MDIRKAKKERIAAIFSGIFCCLLGSYVTGFGAFIVYLAIRSGIKGEVIEDVIIVLLLGLGIMLLSLLVWRLVVRYFKEAKRLKQYIAEHEDNTEVSAITSDDRGQRMFEGVMALAVGAFGIIWMMGLWEAGAWWFAAIGGVIVGVPWIMAAYSLREAFQPVEKRQDAFQTDAPKAPSEKGKRGRILRILMIGALAIYDVIAGARAFWHGISEKELPMFVLFNVLLILAVIVQIRNELRRAKDNR